MNKGEPYGQRRSPPMTPEEREVAVRLKAAELQPAAEPEMQLVLYAEALLDLGVNVEVQVLVERMGLLPQGWRRGAE